MDVHIDDSFFESEEQEGRDCGSAEAKTKANENYCAKRCEIGWFLEEGLPSFATMVNTERSPSPSTHDAVSCERPSSERSDGETYNSDFMLLKYRADLCYSTKDFRTAAALFERVLELLPPLNAMVKREVTDSLARCYSQLGEHQQAKERAEQLVHPPYDSDASSWKLLSQCQKNMGDCEGQVFSLQKCVAMERQHADFWLALAEGYGHLKVAYTNSSSDGALESASGEGSECEMGLWTVTEESGHILHNTVSLFRPYFSWRTVTHATNQNQTKILNTKEECSAYSHDCDLKPKSNYSASVSSLETNSYDHSENGLSVCHRDCPVFNFSQSHKVVSTAYDYPTIVAESGATKLTLCLLHSPFVMLASRQVTVEEFCELLKNLTRSKAVDVWCDFCALAECSCYLWARQLLMYSVRYSNSFAKVTMATKLQQLEDRLSSVDQRTVDFLLHHFSQRTVS